MYEIASASSMNPYFVEGKPPECIGVGMKQLQTGFQGLDCFRNCLQERLLAAENEISF